MKSAQRRIAVAMGTRKKDIFELMSDDELLEQFFGNPPETPAHQQAKFMLEYRSTLQQGKFNRIVMIATVVMAIQAIASVVALFLKP